MDEDTSDGDVDADRLECDRRPPLIAHSPDLSSQSKEEAEEDEYKTDREQEWQDKRADGDCDDSADECDIGGRTPGFERLRTRIDDAPITAVSSVTTIAVTTRIVDWSPRGANESTPAPKMPNANCNRTTPTNATPTSPPSTPRSASRCPAMIAALYTTTPMIGTENRYSLMVASGVTTKTYIKNTLIPISALAPPMIRASRLESPKPRPVSWAVSTELINVRSRLKDKRVNPFRRRFSYA